MCTVPAGNVGYEA